MKESDYEKEILAIIEIKGEVTGFNRLLEMRGKDKKFNPSPASKALKKLEKKRRIIIDKTLLGQTRYRPFAPIFDKAYEKFTESLKPYERTLTNPNLKPDEKLFTLGNYFEKALQIYDDIRLILLVPDLYEANSKVDSLILLQQKLFKKLNKEMNKLTSSEKRYIVNRIYRKPTKLLSLNEYREITHKPTKQEKREEKLMLKLRQIEDHKNSPFCGRCGKKTKDYTVKHKHDDRHLEEVFDKGLRWFYKKYGSGYNEKTGKKLPRDKKLEKEFLRMQKQ